MRSALLLAIMALARVAAAQEGPTTTDAPAAAAPTTPPQAAPAAPEAKSPPTTPPAAATAGSTEAKPAAPAEPPAPSLDFDLLGVPPPPAVTVDADAMQRRRVLLSLHQGFGIALGALMAGSVVTGQLNYNDRFRGSSKGTWQAPHAFLTFATLSTFAGTGLLAVLAPMPIDQEGRGFDRVRLHEAGMIGATAGMIAEGTLGILTAHDEGRIGQARLAQAHLAIGYTTLAFMLTALSAIVF